MLPDFKAWLAKSELLEPAEIETFAVRMTPVTMEAGELGKSLSLRVVAAVGGGTGGIVCFGVKHPSDASSPFGWRTG